jgi:uncharacterized protein YdgA (DUF945 family)
MKRLMGIVLVLVAVVLAALGASTYWFGLQTEREYQAMIQRSSEWQHFKLSGDEYTRGPFSSQARSTLELRNTPSVPNPAAQGEPGNVPFRLLLAHKITHGPIPFGTLPQEGGLMRPALAVIETKVSLDPQLKELLKEIQLPEGFSPSMEVTTVLYWGGKGDTHIVVHPVRTELGSDPKVGIDFSGIKARIEFAPGFKQFMGTFSMDGLNAAIAQEATFQMKNMKCAFQQSEGATGFYLGDVTFDLERVDLTHRDAAKSGENYSMNGFRVKTSTQEAGNDLSSAAAFSLDQLVLKDDKFGKAVFELEFRKLDARALSEFQATMKKLQRQLGGGDQLPEQSLGALMALLPKLFKNSPELEIKQLGFVADNGEVRAGAKLKLDGSKIQDSVNVPMLLNAAELDASLSGNEGTLVRLLKSFESRQEPVESDEIEGEKAAEQKSQETLGAEIKSQLSALVAQNLLTFENGVYKMTARYAKGQLNLNGQTIRLDQLMGQ